MTAKRFKSLLSVSFLMISVLISQLSVAQTGTASFRQKINQDLPSNSAKQITASKIRGVFTASADAIDAIYGTISLADRLGTYNATTGVATISETGATSTLTTTPPVGSKGKYYDVVVTGTNSVTGVSTTWGIGDKIISAATKWDRIPFAISPKTIGKTELKDAGVTFRKTDLFVPGKNLFNVNDEENIIGSFIDQTTGVLTANASQNTTHFIDIDPLQNVSVSSGSAFGARFIWYDANKVFISGVSIGSVWQQAPSNAEYMRVSVNITLLPWATLQVEKGTNQTYFEPFRGVLSASSGSVLVSNALSESFQLAPKNLHLLPGKNLFNIADTDNFLGRFINAKQIDANASYNVTHAIPVTAGQQYTVSFKHNIAWYDQNKVYISQSLSSDANKTQTAPAGAHFMRCTVALASWSTFQVESGSTQTAFEAFTHNFNTVGGVPVKINRAKIADSSTVAGFASSVVSTTLLSATNLNYTLGKNLFNPNDADALIGSFIQYNNGNPSANPTYNSTGFIPVTAGQQYTVSYKHQIAWYNSSKVYISGSASADLAKTQTAPVGAAYLRCTVLATLWSSFQVELGSSQTAFERYAYYIDKIGTTPVIPKNEAVKAETVTTPVIAPKIYIPRQKELSVYFENLCRYYETEGKARTEITLSGVPTTELTIRSRSIKWKQLVGNTSLTAIAGSVKSYGKDFDLLNTLSFTIQPVDQTLTTAKKVMNIGDSFTLREAFVDKVNNGASATGLTFHGMRTSTQSSPVVNHEGRGGWAMTDYHNVKTNLFSPFMQPQSPYKYYGNTSYWIAAIANPTNVGNTNYDAAYVDASLRALYNGTTGFLLSPSVNDVMYSNTDSEYKRWDGSAWVTVTGLTFTFNFTKYRTLYGAPAIDIIHVLLGTNDFSGTDPAGFPSLYSVYKQRMDAMITSFKADNASIKVVIGIPVSSGRQGEHGIVETERRKMVYWLLAKNLIADYGGREAEGIVLADYHSTVDRIYGFDPQPVLPFADYTGTLRDLSDLDYVHLSPDGFKQMGDIYMGAIQSLR